MFRVIRLVKLILTIKTITSTQKQVGLKRLVQRELKILWRDFLDIMKR